MKRKHFFKTDSCSNKFIFPQKAKFAILNFDLLGKFGKNYFEKILKHVNRDLLLEFQNDQELENPLRTNFVIEFFPKRKTLENSLFPSFQNLIIFQFPIVKCTFLEKKRLF